MSDQSDRTREGMARRKADGWRLPDGTQGRPAGRPSTVDQSVRNRIEMARFMGQGWAEIARELNDLGVPTSRGGKAWYRSTVQRVILGTRKVSS